MPAIYIQKIQTDWTKNDRGGHNSELRNKVPETWPIESVDTDDAILLQEIVYGGDYNQPLVYRVREINENQVREQQFEFHYTGDLLHIEYWIDNQIRKRPGVLKLNSWGKLKTNRRFDMDYTWGYYRKVFNIYYGDLSKMKSIIDSRPPEFEKDYQNLLI